MLPTVAALHRAVAAEIGVGAIVDDVVCVNFNLIAIVENYGRIIKENISSTVIGFTNIKIGGAIPIKKHYSMSAALPKPHPPLISVPL